MRGVINSISRSSDDGMFGAVSLLCTGFCHVWKGLKSLLQVKETLMLAVNSSAGSAVSFFPLLCIIVRCSYHHNLSCLGPRVARLNLIFIGWLPRIARSGGGRK